MEWAILWSGVAGVAIVGVVLAAAQVQGANTEDAYFRGSARLWAFVGGVVLAMSTALAPPLMDPQNMGGMPSSAQAVMMVGLAAPPVLAVFACWRNAWSLTQVRRRRADALRHGDEFDAVVLEREYRPFAHDLLAVTVQTTIPLGAAAHHEGGYRTPARGCAKQLRLVETCPGDQWARVAPGRRVRLRLDPDDPSRYALVLFDAA